MNCPPRPNFPLISYTLRLSHYGLIGLSLLCLLTGCCQQKFLKHFDTVSMHSTQWILEARGDTVPFVLQVQVPKGLLCGGLELSLKPFLKQDSLVSPFTIYNKEKDVSSPEYIVIAGRQGGDFLVQGYFMNFPQLQNSIFAVEWRATRNGKTAPLPERLIGYGISQVFLYAQPFSPLKPGFNPAIIREKLAGLADQNAMTHYLQAIMCARLYDGEGVKKELTAAVALDPALKTKARKEVEFIGYRKEDWFGGMVD
jgi:hypothetical protein